MAFGGHVFPTHAAADSAGVKPIGSAASLREIENMSQYAALYSIVFMIGFVSLFDVRHKRQRFWHMFASVALMSPEQVDQIRRIQSACGEA